MLAEILRGGTTTGGPPLLHDLPPFDYRAFIPTTIPSDRPTTNRSPSHT